MRYLLAMVFGVVGAGLAAKFLSGPVSHWLSTSFVYTSPDGQNDMEQFAFIGIMVAGMALGWTLGWAIGTPFAKRKRLD